MAQKPAIFILGVPRSGTTLLRAILDSHSAIACGPETPWLGGHQPRSLMSLWQALRDEPWGYCKSYDMPRDIPTAAAREFLGTLMSRYAQARGKSRWAEKTPDNALHLDFLLEIFPEARFIHLTRDGLDVAMSTSVVAPHRQGISPFLEQLIGFGPDAPAVPNTPFAALLRWRHWNTLIERSLEGREHTRLSYERLVTEPEPTLRELMEFIGESFEPSMLDYARSRHDYPAWEWGSADVQARQVISTSPIGRAKRELSPAVYELLVPIARAAPIAVTPTVLTSTDPDPPAMAELVTAVNELGRPMGLDAIAPDQARAVAWLWCRGLAGFDWRGKRILALGHCSHPLPWILAMLGARVTIRGDQPPPSLVALSQSLRIDLTWTRSIPHGFGADALCALGPSTDPADAASLKSGAPAFIAGAGSAESWCRELGTEPCEHAAEAEILRKP